MATPTQASKEQPSIFNYGHADMVADLKLITNQIKSVGFKPDYILGLTRGGLFPAVMLSHYFNVPMIPINISLRDFTTNLDFVQEQVKNTVGKNVLHTKQILVVDDIVDTGETLHELFKVFAKIKNSSPTHKTDNIKSAALFFNTTNKAKFQPDFCGREIDKTKENNWIVFNSFEDWWK